MKMKKLPAVLVVVMAIMAVGALGALVNYLSNTITANVNVESPIQLEQTTFLFEPNEINGGQYETLLIQGENKLDKTIPAVLEISVFRNDDGEWVRDTDGIDMAFSEDIQYYFHSTYNGTWEEWMVSNPDWFDWYLTSGYPANYDTSLVTNHGNNSVLQVYYDHDMLNFPADIPSGDIYGVIVFQTATNIQPAEYKVEVVIRPNE